MAQGMGRNNFVGAWQLSAPILSRSIGSSIHLTSSSENTESLWLPVPYPSIPPEDSGRQGRDWLRQCQHVSEQEAMILNDSLGNLWTIPPDERLNFYFQRHFPRIGGNFTLFISNARVVQSKLKLLEAQGGSLEITEFDE